MENKEKKQQEELKKIWVKPELKLEDVDFTAGGGLLGTKESVSKFT